MPTTQLEADSPWRRVASQSVHPSQTTLLGPGDLLQAIAAGVGAVTAPLPTLSNGTASESEILLDTPAYQVWIMNLAAGASTDVHVHPGATALHVVSGSVHDVRDGELHELTEGSTIFLPAGVAHSLLSVEASTTIHVHSKEHQ